MSSPSPPGHMARHSPVRARNEYSKGSPPRPSLSCSRIRAPLSRPSCPWCYRLTVSYASAVTVPRPYFAGSNIALSYFSRALFVLISLFIAAFRRSTSGLALSAIRTSETGARSAGISVVRTKIAIWTLAAAIAGIGGGMYVIYAGVALPQSFDTIVGLTWFAVVITNGRRSNNAALAAGLSYVLIPQLFATYLPTSLGPLPTLLFGAGAVVLARNPEGVLTSNGRPVASLARRLPGIRGRGNRAHGAQPALPAPPELEYVPSPRSRKSDRIFSPTPT